MSTSHQGAVVLSCAIWHSRGYLPHWEAGDVPQSITFRLADSLPAALLDRWRDELREMSSEEFSNERRRRIQIALDQGHESGVLANPMIGEMVENALLHFDAERYRLHSWCIMPNHVHVLATPAQKHSLSTSHTLGNHSLQNGQILCSGATDIFGHQSTLIVRSAMKRTMQMQ